jgi:hypothetical protein
MRITVRGATVDRLIDAAFDVLHHDASEGTDVDKYERDTLRKKFKSILYVPRKVLEKRRHDGHSD